MRFNSLLHFALTLTVCLSAGCYHMYGPYGGYPGSYYGTTPYGSPSGYPGIGYPGAPMQTLTPGQQYFPGTTTPSNPPPTFDDGSNGSGSSGAKPAPDPYFSQPANPNSTQLQPQYTPSSTQPLQPARHQESSTLQPLEPTPQRQLRPEAAASPSAIRSPSPATAAAPRQLDRVEASPMGQVDIYSPPAAPPPSSPEASELQFERPMQASPFPGDEPAPSSAPQQTSDPFSSGVELHKVNPYAYDAEYRWLKGIVSRDEQSGNWTITYSSNPPPTDQFAGSVTLAPAPQLARLRDGDVVQVDGRIDPVARDETGRPVYLVTRLERIAAR